MGWGGQQGRSFGKGKNRAASKEGRPGSTDLSSTLRASILKASLSPLLSSGLGGPDLGAHRLDRRNQAFHLGVLPVSGFSYFAITAFLVCLIYFSLPP